MMTRNEMLVKLAAVFQTTADQLTDDAAPGQISGWDSMAAIDVISLLDDAGAGEITAEDAAAFKTIGAILDFAKKHKIMEG